MLKDSQHQSPSAEFNAQKWVGDRRELLRDFVDGTEAKVSHSCEKSHSPQELVLVARMDGNPVKQPGTTNGEEGPRLARTVDRRLEQVPRWTDATKRFHKTGLQIEGMRASWQKSLQTCYEKEDESVGGTDSRIADSNKNGQRVRRPSNFHACVPICTESDEIHKRKRLEGKQCFARHK